MRAEFRAFLEPRNDCTEADQCELVVLACPLGCYQAVNVQHVGAVRRKARELIEDYESGDHACAYGCVEAFGVTCSAGECDVRLHPDGGQTP